MKKAMILSVLVAVLLAGGCGKPAMPPESAEQTTTTALTTTTATTTTTLGAPQLKKEDTCYRLTGDWRGLLSPVSEKAEQVDAYAILKKLRHKEKAFGYALSATLTGSLTLQEQPYYLCEIGQWVTDEDGVRYAFVTWLMVPTDLSAAYVAVTEGDLVWDTADNWFK